MSQDNKENELKLSRRGFPKYNTNPSINDAALTTKKGTKRISNKHGDKFLIVSDQGEIMAPAGFHSVVEVDKTQFIKLYVSGVKAFGGITATGTKLFEIVTNILNENPGKDEIYLSHNVAQTYYPDISYATFKRGMRELIQRNFLFESVDTNLYFVNVNYIFNGNRLAFINEVRLKETARPIPTKEQENLDEIERATGQMNLIKQ